MTTLTPPTSVKPMRKRLAAAKNRGPSSRYATTCCASRAASSSLWSEESSGTTWSRALRAIDRSAKMIATITPATTAITRSEERRVGKERTGGGLPEKYEQKERQQAQNDEINKHYRST